MMLSHLFNRSLTDSRDWKPQLQQVAHDSQDGLQHKVPAKQL